jgi:hypothetical protein
VKWFGEVGPEHDLALDGTAFWYASLWDPTTPPEAGMTTATFELPQPLLDVVKRRADETGSTLDEQAAAMLASALSPAEQAEYVLAQSARIQFLDAAVHARMKRRSAG